MSEQHSLDFGDRSVGLRASVAETQREAETSPPPPDPPRGGDGDGDDWPRFLRHCPSPVLAYFAAIEREAAPAPAERGVAVAGGWLDTAQPSPMMVASTCAIRFSKKTIALSMLNAPAIPAAPSPRPTFVIYCMWKRC